MIVTHSVLRYHVGCVANDDYFDDRPARSIADINLCFFYFKVPVETSQCCQKSPTLKELNELSAKITRNWEFVARRLGVEEAEIERVGSDNVQFPDIRKKAFQVLKVWWDTGDASCRQLVEALDAEDMGSLAEQFREKQVTAVTFSS